MKKRIFTTALLFAIFAMGCSSMKVMVDYDDQFDFSNYKTFNFVMD